MKDSPSPTTRCFDAWALPPTWLLFDDGFVVAVSKPVGVSVSAHERGAEHDLTARLRVAREQPTSYLCPHTHLDRDVSGVVLYAAHRDANASLARQSSQGHFEVTYFACVESKGRFPKEGVFSAWMTRDRKGVFRPGKRNPRELKVWYRVADSSTRRHLLEVRCSQGARGIRAVLANAGAAIAGDRTYGGSPAPRLMLHAAQISMMDPRSGRHVPINAPLPWAFAPWLRGQVDVADIDAHCLKAAFLEAAASRYALVANGKVEAIRLVHGEAEALRGLDIEWFGSYAVVWLTENTEECVQKRVVDSLQVLRPHGVYLKIRPKQASRIVHAQDAKLVQPHAIVGDDAPKAFTVNENDLAFIVDLGEGLNTGLFLDQRSNRKWIRERADGCRMLNLFAYTCSFSVAAAAGGACATTSIDISRRALGIGKRNLEINQLHGQSHEFVCDDVIAWVYRARRKGELFDVVVLDPPSFGTSHRGRFSARQDYVDLAAVCMDLVDEGGVLLASTNHRGVSVGKLRSWLQTAAKRAGRRIELLEDAPLELDFPRSKNFGPHMKSVRCSFGPQNASKKARSSKLKGKKKRGGRFPGPRRPGSR